MSEKGSYGYGASVRVLLLEVKPWEMLRNQVIKPEFSCVAELHDGYRSEQFGDRTDTVDGVGR